MRRSAAKKREAAKKLALVEKRREAAKKAFIERKNLRVRVSVEGFDPYRPEHELKTELINHLGSCGQVFRVIVPTDPIFDSRAFVILLGHGAKDKALQLNGSNIGSDWNALVKIAPEEEEEEYKVESRYKNSLYDELLNDKRFRFGIAVRGYDTSLSVDQVETSLSAHFSCCGVITHVYVTRDKSTNIYFSREEGEAMALNLKGSEVGGFKITTLPLATVRRSNPPLAPGETGIGYSIPAHLIEFVHDFHDKVNTYMTEWRVEARRHKVRALKRKRSATKLSERREAKNGNRNIRSESESVLNHLKSVLSSN